MNDTVNDLDFYVGTWDVANRRLDAPLTGSGRWDEFPAVSIAVSAFGGAANFDEITFPTKGFSGLTLRLDDPARQEWSLYWVSSRRGGAMDPPVVGRFTGGVGEFFADDTHEGTPIRVRYRWSGITATTAHWEQAFSTDGGRTWETNWTMASRRRT